MKKAYFIMDREAFYKIYSENDLFRLKSLVDIEPELIVPVNGFVRDIPSDAEIILSGWGGPLIDGRFLDSMPKLEAVFYGAGSIRGIVTDEFWEKDIVITSSWSANAIPVAEFTLAQIILCLKNTYRLKDLYSNKRDRFDKEGKFAYGTYGTKVGIISLGEIGRLVCRFLGNLDVRLFAYDPFVSENEARELNVTLTDMDYLFRNCHIVSLHAPWIPDTEGMIRERHFRGMLPNSSFINTARGAIVDEDEMIEVLRDRSDITAVLDVTHPEPPNADSPLYEMANVVLTPHIAGSMEQECNRMGAFAVDELERYISNRDLKYRVTKDRFSNMA